MAASDRPSNPSHLSTEYVFLQEKYCLDTVSFPFLEGNFAKETASCKALKKKQKLQMKMSMKNIKTLITKRHQKGTAGPQLTIADMSLSECDERVDSDTLPDQISSDKK